MRFCTLHKLTSYLMVTAAAMAVLKSDTVPLGVAALIVGAIVLSWFSEPQKDRHRKVSALAWNLGTVAVFTWLLVKVIDGASPITAGAYFLLAILVNRLFNRRLSRDYLHAYVISLLLLLVATTMNSGPDFAIWCSIYVVSGVWSLSLLTLRREIEENYLLKHRDSTMSKRVEISRVLSSRRIIKAPFLAGTAALSFGVMLLATAFFLLFPRIGFDLFARGTRSLHPITGFSEEVRLGQHGTIAPNPFVVMRVLFPAGRPRQPLRFRGAVFDHYQAGVWSHGSQLRGRTEAVRPTGGLYVLNQAPGLPRDLGPRALRATLLRQQIYREPLDTSILFAVDRPVALEIPHASVSHVPLFRPRRGPLGEIRAESAMTRGLFYTAYSQVTPVDATVLRAAAHFRDPALDHLLRLPDGLPARIGRLAEQITRHASTDYDKALAVETYLRSHYRYTLALVHDPREEPVDEFLFVTRKGHCEYFASAMTLMLRHLGLHARNVNGFLGGEWNAVGNYLTVRQDHAHAWVEVLLANAGWVTFDPTPAPPSQSAGDPGSLRVRLAQTVDALRLRWLRYVVEYDLNQQAALYHKIQRAFRAWDAGEAGSGESRQRPWLWIAPLVLLAATGAVALVRRRLRADAPAQPSRRRPPAAHAHDLYGQLLVLLSRAGHTKARQQTPLEFALTLAADGVAVGPLVEEFTHCYYRCRYDAHVPATAQAEELKPLLLRIREQLSTQRGGAGRDGAGPASG